eukprot:366232-Chlamydomonas_euryale.AAC.3
MKLLLAKQVLDVPAGVTVEVKGRRVRVKGPRGTLSRDFKHTALDMFLKTEDGKTKFIVESHFTKRKQLASLRTIKSHVQNLVLGVTKGFQYKMRLVYAHFPINVNLEEKGTVVEIRNFLGEKRVRIVKMLPGVTCARSEGVKDELVMVGNDKDSVSRSCALINQSCSLTGRLDLRKFLDGVYISETGVLGQE